MSWKIDKSSSKINFTVRHLMITKVHGTMDRFSGIIEFDPDYPVNSSVRAEIESASINTHLGIRDANVRGSFLKAKKYPLMTYQSKRIEVLDDSHGRIYGDLTIHGMAKQVVLDVEYNGLSQNKDGMTTAAFRAVSCLNRKDWGLKWMALLEIGGLFVGDQVDIEIEVVAVKEADVMPQTMESMQPKVRSTQDAEV